MTDLLCYVMAATRKPGSLFSLAAASPRTRYELKTHLCAWYDCAVRLGFLAQYGRVEKIKKTHVVRYI